MSRIRSRDTLPERMLRLAFRRLGVRYRSHRKIAGVRVDIVLPDSHRVVLVHGCFWHGCRAHYFAPAANAAFWRAKLQANRTRDAAQAALLRSKGWQVRVAWEHSIRHDSLRVARRLARATSGRTMTDE